MEKVILTQITIEEFRNLIREELQKILKELHYQTPSSTSDEIMTIDQASRLLSISKATMYGKTSQRLIPHFKVGKRIYFKRSELINWIAEGKQMTMKEIEMEADTYLKRNQLF